MTDAAEVKTESALLELAARIERNRDSLRYVLNWECRPRTQIGTLYRTFSRYPGEDCSVNNKERLEQLYKDIEVAAAALRARASLPPSTETRGEK